LTDEGSIKEMKEYIWLYELKSGSKKAKIKKLGRRMKVVSKKVNGRRKDGRKERRNYLR